MRTRKWVGAFKWIIVICCLLIAGWQWFLHSRYLSFAPEEMQVTNVLFANEESAGFGPSGKESIFIMYALPDPILAKINTGGATYLSSLPSSRLSNRYDSRGSYYKWNTTPIPAADETWFRVPGDITTTAEPKLDNYLNRYGFGAPVPPNIEAIFNKVVAVPGSFYAYGRTTCSS